MGRNGIYQLIDEDMVTKEREYLDFGGRKVFVPKEDCSQTYSSLAEIDSITTMFHNERDFRQYLKEDGEPTPGRLIYVVYKHKEEQRLACVYNDPVLMDFAKCTIGPQRGSIDTSRRSVRLKLYEIYREIVNPSSEFTNILYDRSKPSYMVNDHNKEMLMDFHNNPPYDYSDENYQLSRFFRAFSSYKEFRALYLNHREYKKKMEIIRQREAERNKEELKEMLKLERNRPLPGQTSLFENK